jgi:hypothetical protein
MTLQASVPDNRPNRLEMRSCGTGVCTRSGRKKQIPLSLEETVGTGHDSMLP